MSDDDGRTSLESLYVAGRGRRAPASTAPTAWAATRCSRARSWATAPVGTRAGSAHGPVIHSDGAGFSARSVSGDLDLQDLDNALRALMWRLVGIERDGPGLEQAASRLATWHHLVSQRVFGDPAGWVLVNKMLAGWLIARSALARQESRGTHYRRDYPEPDDVHWRRDLDVARPDRT
jgi:L-aspartate oxidase